MSYAQLESWFGVNPATLALALHAVAIVASDDFLVNLSQLHQSMPSVMTCLVAKRLGNKFSDNHWELRDFTAKLVALICRR